MIQVRPASMQEQEKIIIIIIVKQTTRKCGAAMDRRALPSTRMRSYFIFNKWRALRFPISNGQGLIGGSSYSRKEKMIKYEEGKITNVCGILSDGNGPVFATH